MSGRRVPLSSNPNAVNVNSPYRAVTSTAAAKQKRSHATLQREDSYGGQPPAKKQMLDSQSRTPPRQQPILASAEGRVFTRKSNASQPTAFERSCLAASQKTTQQAVSRKVEKLTDEGLESIRQWQKHIRRTFPRFIFYFESVSEEGRLKCTKQVTALGAREEKFFSNAVTHVVTTRAIPPEQDQSSAPPSATIGPQVQNNHLRTINPSLLERSTESTNIQTDLLAAKAKFTFEVSLNKRMPSTVQEAEVKRPQARNADVLYRARELGMKIWTLEKLQRMMNTMFDTDSGYQTGNGHNAGSNSVASLPRTTREGDLSQMLRNERINGPSDRDLTVATKEMVIFKGPFIYIHDIDEKQRPIMVREYAKVAHKEDGDWPQFRSVANGKCPFVEDVDHSRREAEKDKEMLRLQKQQEKEKSMIPRTRTSATTQEARMHPPTVTSTKRPLAELEDGSNRTVTVMTKQTNLFDPAKTRVSAEPSSRGPQNAFISRAGTGRLFGGEPVASGVQPSNITSAIRSQMISSTAAQPGAKAGTSKEVHGLQRKVLEKTSGGPASYGGAASSHRMTDINNAAKEEMAVRAGKRKEKLDLIEEDVNLKLEKRDPKPGYCENCQDKFEDFDEHIQSRKHRKFAEKLDNWQELDALLNQLARPLREAQEVF
ncbi:hypothetical protein OIDMADRAFT_122891 [Oidiodendron maius Zn]|uniref:DBF4-type domain-containing protein n=1 Tax=Oidiodendron maius (strain Zn) TaxID=913774 RepID=A0A0C3DGW3_OIDMZ|nr:hypothetical protein OIDMADRAFT_122891 [Oidiodendron maius Zn]